MNITAHTPTIPIPTVVNPATDALRRENHQREVITKPAAAQQSAAEKGVASDRDKSRTPAQNNEQVDFENIRKQAELANKTISDEENESDRDSEKNQDTANAKTEQKNNDSVEESENDSKRSEDNGLDYNDQQVVKELQLRDREVRSHEAAHAAAGGVATGAPSFSFQVGPDGKQYAVEGEVSVDLSPVAGNPNATITKMQKVYNAALAPANPSIQDTRVANSAAQLIAQAQSELMAQKLDDPEQERDLNRVISRQASFSGEQTSAESKSDFDRHIEKTLEAQEQISPTRSVDVDQRALRIENFYATINNAYEKPSAHQFELTA